MIPTVQCQRTATPQNIRYDVIQIKLSAIVRNQALYKLTPDTQDSGADNECEFQVAVPRRVEHPVEADCEKEEGEEVQCFVVYDTIELERGEAGVASEDEETDECAWGDG